MDLMELLRRMQAPAVDTETGFYDTYQPKVKQVITETDDDQPNKRVTTIDYPQRQFIPGDTGVYGASLSPSFSPTLMQSEEKIPRDQLYTDTLGDSGMTKEQIVEIGLDNVKPLVNEGAMPVNIAGTVLRTAPKAISAAEKWLIQRGYMKPRYTGATRAGEPIVGRDPITGKMKTEFAKYPGQYAQGPMLTGKGIATGVGLTGAGLVGLSGGDFIGIPGMEISVDAVKDAISNVTPEQYVPEIPDDAYAASDAAPPKEPPVGNNLDEANKKINSGLGQDDPVKYEILQSMYGKYARDPKARKQQYLDQISKIYRNAMILNAIAELTGGRSQAGMYVKMATDKLDAIEKFDNEERMHGIWKDVFFDQSGQFRSPSNWQETYNAAIKLGATPEEAKELADTTFGAGGGKTTAAMQNFAWYNSLTGAEKELAARILKIDQNNVGTLSPSNLVTLVQSEAFSEFDQDEQRRVIAIIKKLIPGFEANVSNSDISNPQQKEASVGKAPQGAIDLLKANKDSEMHKREFLRKYGYLPELN